MSLFKALPWILLLFALAPIQAWTTSPPSTARRRISTKVDHTNDQDDTRDPWKASLPTVVIDVPQLVSDSEIPPATFARRQFLKNSSLLVAMSCITTFSTILFASRQPAVAASSGDDPFSQLDSIASAFSDRPSSMAPLSPGGGSPTEDASKLSDSQRSMIINKNGGATATFPPPTPPSTDENNNLSELDAALQESRKRRRIDPRTHG